MNRKFDLIAIDVDGTLLNDRHQLTPTVIEAVREAAESGAEIVLATGRGPINSIPLLEEIGLAGTLITHNGAATVESEGRRVLHSFSIPHEAMVPYMEYCRENGVHFDINTAFDMYNESSTPEADAMYVHYRVVPIRRRPDDPLPPDLVKFTAFGSKEQMDRVQREWEAWDSPLRRIRSGDWFIDVQHADVSKGKALERLASLRGIDRSRIMAIGNYYNDIDMLRFAGLGIAMGNSPDEVKRAADAVTLSNEEDGVAHAIRRYALGASS
ncbi:MAG: Cof-type HAD-IIB family hydrolase [Thermobacillus sp.]|jgi:Cof subfamily protein (haloacid dehalogenase superfamily)|uniref:Cof family protein n=1 Tax=Thermobacillus xylanilyticus TaxID=76633 RepID=A0ABM8V633_THEXY|nr:MULTISPECIES: Cof-type HAD-IIB family hydrolase [Thermobacillus]REK57273.1 MAG: Cof-type HAD-IIB family hydrolase [Thermobacillus sp.]CAG5088405.1 Cof family protein [Thermobacillus xylanilyticus]